MTSTIFLSAHASAEVNSPNGYLVGFIIALIILGYLIYSLVKPERF
ncbi:MAG: potassium-transporting ATPase subunit F [Lentimicrobium sp.]|nr:potassium-transporting ATPase subunit F [Lentimicrobium sp.]